MRYNRGLMNQYAFNLIGGYLSQGSKYCILGKNRGISSPLILSRVHHEQFHLPYLPQSQPQPCKSPILNKIFRFRKIEITEHSQTTTTTTTANLNPHSPSSSPP